ncbi:unnamed protein product [Caenorhabditis sp. 36 PRJEB53466]|nr:unnamed protein product [Caenorhabditis sp. 36 PRJEB53466]
MTLIRSPPPSSNSANPQDLHRATTITQYKSRLLPIVPPLQRPNPVVVPKKSVAKISKPVKYPTGNRTGKDRKMIDEFRLMGSLKLGEDKYHWRKERYKHLKEMINMMVDYMELNYSEEDGLPEFPEEFHEQIRAFCAETLVNYSISCGRIHEAIHECVKRIKGCEKVEFDHFSMVSRAECDKIWKTIEEEKRARAESQEFSEQRNGPLPGKNRIFISVFSSDGVSADCPQITMPFGASSSSSSSSKYSPPPPPPANPSTGQPAKFSYFMKLPDGTELPNPDAYDQMGFGWVRALHPTRVTWRKYVNTPLDTPQIKGDGMDIVDQKWPNWRTEKQRERSRSRSRSPPVRV